MVTVSTHVNDTAGYALFIDGVQVRVVHPMYNAHARAMLHCPHIGALDCAPASPADPRVAAAHPSPAPRAHSSPPRPPMHRWAPSSKTPGRMRAHPPMPPPAILLSSPPPSTCALATTETQTGGRVGGWEGGWVGGRVVCWLRDHSPRRPTIHPPAGFTTALWRTSCCGTSRSPRSRCAGRRCTAAASCSRSVGVGLLLESTRKT